MKQIGGKSWRRAYEMRSRVYTLGVGMQILPTAVIRLFSQAAMSVVKETYP